jgi:hypothetical protein
MFKTASILMSVASVWTLAARPAVAAERERELPSVEDLSVQPEIFLIPDGHKQDCPRTGTVCLFGNGGGTIAGIDVNPTVGIVTTLARGTQVAGMNATAGVPEADVWHVEMLARLRARATAQEPVIVAVMDYADPDGMARKEATAVWQIDGASAKDIGMRFVLSAEDGFLPRHTYLVRMVQGVGKREKVLAEGNFLLE